MQKLKIGILADSIIQSGFNGEVLEKILGSENLDIKALILNNRPNKRKRFLLLFKKYSIIRLFEKFLFLLLFKFEKFICRLFNKKIKFSTVKLKTTVLNVFPEIKKNNFYTYNSSDLEKIKNLELDIILRMGSGILKDKILKITKFGIISYHLGDNDFYRGGPAGFWEVYNKEPATGFIIQRLNNELDNGEVLFKGHLITKNIYYLNYTNLCKNSAKYILHVLSKIQKQQTFKNYGKSIYFNPLYKEPRLIEITKYLLNTYINIFIKNFSKFFFKQKWKVAYVKGNIFQKRLENYKIIKSNKNTFFADPFLWKYKDNNYLFVEEYNFKKHKAHISGFVLKEKEAKYLGTILEEDFHLSFPFIFNYKEKIYLCPETRQKNEIRLYECVEFPMKWKFSKTLISNISAVDTIIFEKNLTWWLLTNSGFSDLNKSSELNIFYSKDGPLTSDWIPHKKNPIYVDSRIARNGGIAFNNHDIYRINQKFGFGQYGKEFDLNLIEEINEENFIEKKICNIKPLFFRKINGTHHFNNNEDFCTIDFI